MRLSKLQKIILLTGLENEEGWLYPHKAARQYYGETRTYKLPQPIYNRKKGAFDCVFIDYTEKVYGGYWGHETTDRAIRAALSRSLRILDREGLTEGGRLMPEGAKVARKLRREAKTLIDVNPKGKADSGSRRAVSSIRKGG